MRIYYSVIVDSLPEVQLLLTLSLRRCHLKTTSKRVKFQILKHFSFLFRITRDRVGIKTLRTESTFVTGPEKCTVCRRVRALFSPEILQAQLDSDGVNCNGQGVRWS